MQSLRFWCVLKSATALDWFGKFADQRRVSFTTFQQCQWPLWGEKDRSEIFLLSKPPKNYWSFMKLHTLATNSCFDWLTCNRIQSCLEQNVQRPRYESETLDKCQWCTQALFQTLWQDIFGRLVVQNSLARYLVLNTYTFERRDIHSILSS